MKQKIFSLVIKYLKAKYRSPVFTIWCWVWPTILFYLLTLIFNYTKYEMNQGFFDSKSLPSNGIGPFTYDLFCKSSKQVEFHNLNKVAYESSRYRRVFELLEKILNKNQSRDIASNFFDSYLKFIIMSGDFYSKYPNSYADLTFEKRISNMLSEPNYESFQQNYTNSSDTEELRLINNIMNINVNLLYSAVNLIRLPGISESLIKMTSMFFANNGLNMNSIGFICGKLDMNNEYMQLNSTLSSFFQVVNNVPFNFTYINLNTMEVNITSRLNKCSTLNDDWKNFSSALKSHKIIFSPDTQDVKTITDYFDKYFEISRKVIEQLDYSIEDLAEAYCYFREILYNRKEYFFIASGIFFDQIVERIIGLPEIYFPISMYTKIVKNQNITKSEIVSPFIYREGPYIGVHLLDEINDQKLEKKYKYSIIAHNDLVFERNAYWSPPLMYDLDLFFVDSFWSVVQDLMDNYIIKSVLNINELKNIQKYIKRAPLNCDQLSRSFLEKLLIIPNMLSIALIPSLIYISKYIINERDSSLISYLSYNGISEYFYVIFTMFLDMIFSIIFQIPVVVLIHYMKIIEYSSILLTFFWVISNIFASYCFFYLICSIFKNVSFGVVLGIISIFLGGGPYMIRRFNIFLEKRPFLLFISFLFYQSSVTDILNQIVYIEYFRKDGAKMADLISIYLPLYNNNILFSIFMVFFDGLLYIFISMVYVYINKTGQHRFIILYIRSLWIERKLCLLEIFKRRKTINFPINNETVGSSLIPQYPDCNSEYTVFVNNITVTLNGKNKIIDGLSMGLYPNKIYLLLGENGSGKSTLIKSILGIIKPCHGNVTFQKDKSIEAANFIGYCPQHDLIIEYLTVTETIYFYWRLKLNTSPGNYTQLIDEMIEVMGLSHLRNTLSGRLSGGQKRKLSIGIAFIGNPKLVILDEPTSGVDPESKRAVYDYILKNSHNKTILITTHHMEETEIIGDEIFIMSSGKFIENGTLLQLKSKYGCKSKLTIELDFSKDSHEYLLNHVYKKCEHIMSHKIISNEIIFDINSSYKNNYSLENLFLDMNYNKNKYGIIMWTLNDCSMEEVFINIFQNKINQSTDNNSHCSFNKYPKENTQDSEDLEIGSLISNLRKQRKELSYCTQAYYTLERRITHTLRSKKFYLIQLFLPAFVQLLACLLQYLVSNRIKTGLNINMNEILKFTDIYLPIQHDYVKNNGEINKLLLNILQKDNTNTNSTHSNMMLEKNFFEILNSNNTCLPVQRNICSFLKTEYKEIIDYSKKFSILKMPGYDKINIQLIGNCSMDDFLIATNRIYPYRRYFSLNFHRENSNYNSDGATDITIMNEHSIGDPLTINFINNMAFKINAKLAEKNNSDEYSIEVINDLLGDSMAFYISIKLVTNKYFILIASVCYSLCIFTFPLSPTSDKVSGFQKTQYLMNLRKSVYWLCYYFTDMTIYIISCTLCFMIIFLFHVDELVEPTGLISLSIGLFLFCYSLIPFSYVLTFIHNSPNSTIVTSIVSACSIIAISFIFEERRNDPEFLTPEIKSYIFGFLSIFPHYNLQKIFTTLLVTSDLDYQKRIVRVTDMKNQFIALFIFGTIMIIIHFALIYLSNIFNINKKCFKIKKENLLNNDSDIVNENNFVENCGDLENSALILKNVYKVFTRGFKFKKNYAVKNVSFSVRNNECFGLLGMNGAGKSTIFKMIIKDENISSGNITKLKNKDGVSLTYCPQTDNLDMLMNPKEHIKYLCRLSGYSEDVTENIIRDLIYIFKLNVYENCLAKNMSFGNRRKLSCALCAIGDPKIILMDEPTSGVDPSSRKFVWDFIKQIKTGKSILYTSHCMKECEMYSQRIAIMVRGELKCIGSPEHIKEKFGGGYELKLKINQNFTEEIENIVLKTFKECRINVSCGFINCSINISHEKLVLIFTFIKIVKKIDPTVEYTINQSSLENVFKNLLD